MTSLTYMIKPGHTVDELGLLPFFLVGDDERPAAEQYDERYKYGGWRPIEGFTLDRNTGSLLFPGDPPLEMFAFTTIRDETVMFYPHQIVAIAQPDGSFQAARLD